MRLKEKSRGIGGPTRRRMRKKKLRGEHEAYGGKAEEREEALSMKRAEGHFGSKDSEAACV
jgi:hypothetical protein